MNVAYFGDHVNSYQKYGLILTSKVINPAKARTMLVDVPGRDGVLDITETMGIVRYKNRQIVLNFALVGSSEKNMKIYGNFANDWNGAKIFPSFSDDPEYHYDGRVTDMTFVQTKNVAEITMTIDAFPYAMTKKYFYVKADTSNGDVTIEGSRMPTVPILIVEGGSTDISFEGNTYHVEEGTYAIPTIVIKKGINTFHVEGEGLVTFKYKKGKL